MIVFVLASRHFITPFVLLINFIKLCPLLCLKVLAMWCIILYIENALRRNACKFILPYPRQNIKRNIKPAADAAEYKNRRNVCTRRNLKLVLNAFRSRRGI